LGTTTGETNGTKISLDTGAYHCKSTSCSYQGLSLANSIIEHPASGLVSHMTAEVNDPHELLLPIVPPTIYWIVDGPSLKGWSKWMQQYGTRG